MPREPLSLRSRTVGSAHPVRSVRLNSRKETVQLVFETCGSQEYPDRILKNVSELKDLGFNAAAYVSPDTAHEWQTWRRSLYQFLPLIFQ